VADDDPLNIPGIPGSEPPAPAPEGPPTWLWLELAAAVLLTGFVGFASLGFVLNAAGANSGTSRGGQLVGAFICIGLTVLCARWAVHVEHRLRRRRHAVARTFEAAAAVPGGGVVVAPSSAGAPPAPARRPRRRRRHTYGPVAVSIFVLLFAGATVGCIFGSFSAHAAGAKSSYTQGHGTRTTGTVELVNNEQSCGRYSCSYTSRISVSLSPPVDGVDMTIVHFPDYSSLNSGDQVPVLVDPKDPSYAELPGHTFQSSWVWLVPVVLGILCAGLTALEARLLLRILRHRREHRDQAASGLPTGA
jgi:hypothetical protein